MFRRQSSVGHLVNWAARIFAREADRRLKPLGLSAGQVPVLLALSEETRLSQAALVARSSAEQPTIAVTLTRMERDGLIQRERNPDDARAWLFRLTDKAQAHMPAVFEALGGGNDMAMGGFTGEERAIFLALLQRLVENMRDHEAGLGSPRRSTRRTSPK